MITTELPGRNRESWRRKSLLASLNQGSYGGGHHMTGQLTRLPRQTLFRTNCTKSTVTLGLKSFSKATPISPLIADVDLPALNLGSRQTLSDMNSGTSPLGTSNPRIKNKSPGVPHIFSHFSRQDDLCSQYAKMGSWECQECIVYIRFVLR